MNYNENKGGVASFNQMCQNMNAGRKTKRWPLCVFQNMINIIFYIHVYMYIAYYICNKLRNNVCVYYL